jgi:hypothetical protein
MGIDLAELKTMLKDQTISVEAAGAGFAAAIALAERYRGQEIFSLQALTDAGIAIPTGGTSEVQIQLTGIDFDQIHRVCQNVRTTLAEQSEGWKKRPLFERQWMIRSFKQRAGMSVEHWLELLDRLDGYSSARNETGLANLNPPLPALVKYYGFLYDTAKGYLKDPAQREEQLNIVRTWQEDVQRLADLLKIGSGEIML